MKKVLGLVGTLLLLSAMVPAAVSADSRCNGGSGVTLYDNVGYGGASKTFCRALLPTGGPTVNRLSPYGWNDRASSYQVFNTTASQCYRFYEHEYFSGTTLTTCGNGNIYDLRQYYTGRWDGWNDTMSSFKALW